MRSRGLSLSFEFHAALHSPVFHFGLIYGSAGCDGLEIEAQNCRPAAHLLFFGAYGCTGVHRRKLPACASQDLILRLVGDLQGVLIFWRVGLSATDSDCNCALSSSRTMHPCLCVCVSLVLPSFSCSTASTSSLADTSGSIGIRVLNFVSKGPAVQQQLDAFAHIHRILMEMPLTMRETLASSIVGLGYQAYGS